MYNRRVQSTGILSSASNQKNHKEDKQNCRDSTDTHKRRNLRSECIASPAGTDFKTCGNGFYPGSWRTAMACGLSPNFAKGRRILRLERPTAAGHGALHGNGNECRGMLLQRITAKNNQICQL